MNNDDIINLINSSTLEKNNNRSIGLFTIGEACPNNLYKTTNSIHFTDESWILVFNTDTDTYQRVNRDTRRIFTLTKTDFLVNLNILIEMDKLRQDRVRLRKMILYNDISEYKRDFLLKDIID